MLASVQTRVVHMQITQHQGFACHSSAGQDFATRIGNVFIIGRGDKPLISLPKAKGIKYTIVSLPTSCRDLPSAAS